MERSDHPASFSRGCRGCAYLAEPDVLGVHYPVCRHREVQRAMYERRQYRLKRSLPGCKYWSAMLNTSDLGRTPLTWDEFLKNRGISRVDPLPERSAGEAEAAIQSTLF